MRIKQVENVLDLFELFARDKSPLTLTDLSRLLDMPKSSTFNLIDTLVARGFLYETRNRGGYYPTRRIRDVAADIMDGDALLETIHGELEMLAAATGETVLLASRDAAEVLYVDVVESSSPIRYHARIGDRRPVFITSSGKAILMSLSRTELDAVTALAKIRLHNGQEKAPEALLADLQAARRRGWSEDRAESTPDVMGLGVPVKHGERLFGLALAGPLYRVRSQRASMASSLQETAARIQGIFASPAKEPR